MTYTVFPLYYSQTENNMSKSNPPSQRADSAEYLQRKSFFDQLITVYGRKPVVEILVLFLCGCIIKHIQKKKT